MERGVERGGDDDEKGGYKEGQCRLSKIRDKRD